VFWVWNGNDVGNILMFLVVARKSRTLQLLMLAWPVRCTGSWERIQLRQLTQTVWSNIPYRVTSCSVYIYIVHCLSCIYIYYYYYYQCHY